MVVGLALALMPGSLSAATSSVLYVDRANPACSDAGSGTVDQPFCTISAAASKVVAGQTVQVASGTYPERVVVSSSGTSGAPIVFGAAPGASVTVSGQANGFYFSSKSWVTVQGFNVIKTYICPSDPTNTGTGGWNSGLSSYAYNAQVFPVDWNGRKKLLPRYD